MFGLHPDKALLLQVWGLTRLVMLAVLVFVVQVENRTFVDTMQRWDVLHFAKIATEGYADKKEIAFFPALPTVMKIGDAIGLPMWFSGAALAIVASLLAAWALYRLGGVLPAALWLVCPTTVFTTVAYTEAPFCAAAFWAWERARRGRWLEAGLLALVACSFRVSGLFLVGALVLLALVGDGRWGKGAVALPANYRDRVRNALWMAIPAFGLFLWALYLHRLTGSWTAWFDAQSAGWSRSFTSPLESFESTWRAAKSSSWSDRPKVAWVFRAELVTMAVGVATVVVTVLKKRWASAAFVAVMVFAFGTSTWWLSASRAALLWFPTFIVLGELAAWAGRGKGLYRGTIARGVVAQVFGFCLLAAVVWAWLLYRGEWAS